MKLEVGDISMDSQSGIAFGDSDPPARGAPAPEPRATTRNASGWLDGLSDRSRAALAVGALSLAAAATVLFAIWGAWSTPWVLLLMPAPGLVALAGVVAWPLITNRTQTSPEPAAVDRDRARRLADHLAGRADRPTVEGLMDELGWREHAVVSGLKIAVDRGLVAEDLDVDSGHWVYAPATPEEPRRRALPVADRIHELEDDKDAPTSEPDRALRSHDTRRES